MWRWLHTDTALTPFLIPSLFHLCLFCFVSLSLVCWVLWKGWCFPCSYYFFPLPYSDFYLYFHICSLPWWWFLSDLWAVVWKWGWFTTWKTLSHNTEMPLKVHFSLSRSFKVPVFDHFPPFQPFLPLAVKLLHMAELGSGWCLWLCPCPPAGYWSVLVSLWVTCIKLHLLMAISCSPWCLWYLLISFTSLVLL